MFKFIMKGRLLVALFGFMMALMATGCLDSTEGDPGQLSEDTQLQRAVGRDYLSTFGYPYGPSAAFWDGSSLTEEQRQAKILEVKKYLLAEYRNWVATYVTSSGAGVYLRVKRDFCTNGGPAGGNAAGVQSNWDTVSEGQAYGMLLAVYFDDKSTFDKLWMYAKVHSSPATGLMHWKVKADGTNISEFGIPIPHGSAYMGVTYWKLISAGSRTFDDVLIYAQPAGNITNINNSWNRTAATGCREYSSASDADFDMAAALCMAAKKWNVSSIPSIKYVNEAINILIMIHQYNCKWTNDPEQAFINNGDSWNKGNVHWNPSYFTPAWFKLYNQFLNTYRESYRSITGKTPDDLISRFERVTDNVYKHMGKISENGPLFPDWCKTTLNNTTGVFTMERALQSDRRYWLDINPKDGTLDELVNDGVLDSNDAYNLASYNFYYDAVRVPWRLAVDYSWSNDSRALAILGRMNSFFYQKGAPGNILDGYTTTGGAWSWDYRDGFNNGRGGLYNTVPFVSGIGCSYMAASDGSAVSKRKEFYDATVKMYNANCGMYDKYHYYGNTLRMLTLVYLSGFMTNPYN